MEEETYLSKQIQKDFLNTYNPWSNLMTMNEHWVSE